MTHVKAPAFREMNGDEIRARVAELREDLFNLRFRNTMKQLDNPLKIRESRREMARRRPRQEGELHALPRRRVIAQRIERHATRGEDPCHGLANAVVRCAGAGRHANTNRACRRKPIFGGVLLVMLPGAPVMPGVLVVEALAQVGAVLALREIEDRDQKLVLFTGIKEARFRRPVVPGDTLVLEVTALRIGSRVQRMRGEAKVDGQLAADAEIMSIVAPRE